MERLISYAETFIGSNDPQFISDILLSAGETPDVIGPYDLFARYRMTGRPARKEGCLAFFGSAKDERVESVGFMVDEWRMLILEGDKVVMRPLTFRQDLIATFMPPYEFMSHGFLNFDFTTAPKKTFRSALDKLKPLKQPQLPKLKKPLLPWKKKKVNE